MTTPSINLEKPPVGERLDISLGRLNSNFDKIDAAVANRSLVTHSHGDLATNTNFTDYKNDIDILLAMTPGVGP